MRVFVYGCDTRFQPILFYFDSDEHQEAIAYGLKIANEWEKISRVQVIDAWGMLIAQFCAAWLYLGEKAFDDKKMDRRPPQSPIAELQSGTAEDGQ